MHAQSLSKSSSTVESDHTFLSGHESLSCSSLAHQDEIDCINDDNDANSTSLFDEMKEEGGDEKEEDGEDDEGSELTVSRIPHFRITRVLETIRSCHV